ncbi:hypothetical protein BDW74DRAFT_189697 [Aspergillus multicolor]|uniref:uncharacterized protein n=1 Tax=Aspergillus multicolor TaxID=41759 RepID=UPI003CCE17F3
MAKRTRPEKPHQPLDQLPLPIRANIKKYDPNACNAALNGLSIPVTLGYELIRFCVFPRALNAREVMSNIIPNMNEADEVLYCIWHPDVPTPATLRALVARYPGMVYQAARVCAVAGYSELYRELDVLPEVHIAEVAAHATVGTGNRGSKEIWQSIISQPLKYAVMNDYERTINTTNPRPANLNGDPAVYSSLNTGRKHRDIGELESFYQGYHNHYRGPSFNITEYWSIDSHDYDAPAAPEGYYPLLYSPLPTDLPSINKDKLILVAAYHGDIDRYVRLCRPVLIPDEFLCIVRGIYLNPFWAKWWSTQIAVHIPKDQNPTNPMRSRFTEWEETLLQRSINARRIMSDETTWVTQDTPGDLLPANIWYHGRACAETYERLARIRPDMLRRCLRACIVADYPETSDRLLLMGSDAKRGVESEAESEKQTRERKLRRLAQLVSPSLWLEATASWNEQYKLDIASAVSGKSEALELNFRDVSTSLGHMTVRDLYLPRPQWDSRWVDRFDLVQVAPGGEYDGVSTEILSLDFAVIARDALGVDHTVWRDKGDARLDMLEVYEFLDSSSL